MSKWEKVAFGDILTIVNGKNQKHVENPSGNYPIYGSGGIMGYANDFLCNANTVVIGRKGTINRPIFVEEPFWNVDTAFGLIAGELLYPKFLYYFCEYFDFEALNTTVTIPSLTKANLLKVKMPLPPLSIQRLISNILDRVYCIIANYKEQIEQLDLLVKSRFVEMFGDPEYNNKGLPLRKLSELCNVGSSKRIYQEEQTMDGVPFWRISDLVAKMDTGNVESSLFIPKSRYEELKGTSKNVKFPLAYHTPPKNQGDFAKKCMNLS